MKFFFLAERRLSAKHHGVRVRNAFREIPGTLWTRAMTCNGADYLIVDQVDDGGHDEHGPEA